MMGCNGVSVHSGAGRNDRMAEMAEVTEMLRNHDTFVIVAIIGYYVHLTMSIRLINGQVDQSPIFGNQ